MKNRNLSLLDREQIAIRLFDGEQDAQRVILVGSDIAESIKESLKDLKIEVKSQPQILAQPEIKTIEIPTIIKEVEIKEIEKVIVVPEYRLIEIEKPVIIKEVQVIEVEKAIIQTEVKTVEVSVIPKAFLWLFVVQIFINLVTLILHK